MQQVVFPPDVDIVIILQPNKLICLFSLQYNAREVEMKEWIKFRDMRKRRTAASLLIQVREVSLFVPLSLRVVRVKSLLSNANVQVIQMSVDKHTW